MIEVCQRYRHGVRGILKAQTQHLVSKYLEVEAPFQVRHEHNLYEESSGVKLVTERRLTLPRRGIYGSRIEIFIILYQAKPDYFF